MPYPSPQHMLLGLFLRNKLLTAVGVLLVAALMLGDGGYDDPAGAPQEASAESASQGESSEAANTPSATESPAAEHTPETEDAPAEASTTTPRSKSPKPTPHLHKVARVIDGDTLELGNGENVRLVGIDTPERGDCGYDRAANSLRRMVEGERVKLTKSDENRDKYDRLLRYVNVGKRDAGLRQIKRGLAIARYDSRDGYGYHPREDRYIAADKASKNVTCKPKPNHEHKPKPQPQQNNCAEGYSPCIPPYPPDLDCSDVNGPIRVTGSDPHGLDRDGDGVACE